MTADAVELWADRAMGDFEKKVGRNAPSKQKAMVCQCFPYFFSQNHTTCSFDNISEYTPVPCQKLAQRDQPAMVELLQICSLMNYVWPKIETHLGKGKLLEGILEQWKMGCLRFKLHSGSKPYILEPRNHNPEHDVV